MQMLNSEVQKITYTILILFLLCSFGQTQNKELTSVQEFIESLSFKGPDVGGTFEKPDSNSQWSGSIIYSSSTKYINWFFAFSYDGRKGYPVDFLVQITREEKIVYEKISHYDFANDDGFYFDGFKIENQEKWPAGEYHISWSAEGHTLTSTTFNIYEDDVKKNEIVDQATIRDFEIYFLESEDAYRDYTYHNNYHFPYEKVRFIAWRTTINLPYSINQYDLNTEIKIYSQNGELVDSSTGKTDSKEYPGFYGKMSWLPNQNWPKGNYKMEFLLEDRMITSRDFYIE